MGRAAPMALGIMTGIPAQPFRAGLTFSGGPPGLDGMIWAGPKEGVREPEKNRRSLHCAPPDFLWTSVALVDLMRLSLKRKAHTRLCPALRGRKSGFASVLLVTQRGRVGFHWRSVHGTPGQVAGIPGLKSETWGTLRLLPTQRTE
jgi:hypothetical protein